MVKWACNAHTAQYTAQYARNTQHNTQLWGKPEPVEGVSTGTQLYSFCRVFTLFWEISFLSLYFSVELGFVHAYSSFLCCLYVFFVGRTTGLKFEVATNKTVDFAFSLNIGNTNIRSQLLTKYATCVSIKINIQDSEHDEKIRM